MAARRPLRPFRLLPQGPLTEEATSVLAELQNTEVPVRNDDLDRYVAHAEEAVRLAAFRRITSSTKMQFHAISAELDREPTTWTPISAQMYRYPNARLSPAIEGRQRPFKRWLKRAPDPQEVLEALELDTEYAWEAVAQGCVRWSPELVSRLFHRGAPFLWSLMANNRAITGDSLETLVGEGYWESRNRSIETVEYSRASRLLRRLAEHGTPPPLTPAEFADETARRTTEVPITSRHARRSASEALVTAFTVLSLDRELTQSDWTRYLATGAPYPYALAQLVQHPDCPDWVALQALETFPSIQPVRTAVARVPRFLASKEVRAQLLSRGADGGLLSKVRGAAEPGEVDAYFAAVAARSPKTASRLLADDRGPRITASSATLEGLLTNDDADTRTRTLAALANLDVDDSAPPAPSAPGRRRR